MRGARVRPIVIAAGGTGGHFFPAEALAAELAQRGRRICLMTDARSAGFSSTVFEGRERFTIAGAGVFGRGFSRGARAALALARGTVQARGILAGLDAAVVIGFGGYPAVAPILGARLLRRRPALLLHDQNAVLGRANRLLARFADHLALTHAQTRHVPAGVATTVTGNPVRPAIAALAGSPFRMPEPECRILVLGGSQGARVFSDVVPAALARLSPGLQARLRVTQQCRPEDLDRVRAAYAASGVHADLASFFADIAGLLAGAHLVIARAGASTVAELAVIGRPALLVPLPGAIDDDQSANARALTDEAAGWMMPQPGFSPEALAARLESLFAEPALLAATAARAAGLGRADAALRLADLVEKLAGQDSLVQERAR
jgi:UDP-N-acetylglucosamine--N-acetylmuramyl-(pentapeptide) pyrophosphoryl-undecaprenol N-acetylglucosamine transferase